MKMILFTAVHCPKCPGARKVVRDAATELGLKEGIDFIEKIIDGNDLQIGKADLEGELYTFVKSEKDISETPAAVVGGDIMLEALMYQIASTPSIVINDEAVFMSKIPTKEELINALK